MAEASVSADVENGVAVHVLEIVDCRIFGNDAVVTRLEHVADFDVHGLTKGFVAAEKNSRLQASRKLGGSTARALSIEMADRFADVTRRLQRLIGDDGERPAISEYRPHRSIV